MSDEKQSLSYDELDLGAHIEQVTAEGVASFLDVTRRLGPAFLYLVVDSDEQERIVALQANGEIHTILK